LAGKASEEAVLQTRLHFLRNWFIQHVLDNLSYLWRVLCKKLIEITQYHRIYFCEFFFQPFLVRLFLIYRTPLLLVPLPLFDLTGRLKPV